MVYPNNPHASASQSPHNAGSAGASAGGMKYERRAAVGRIVLIYATFAGLWILVSDRMLAMVVSDPEVIIRLAIAKGWLFVAITSGLLYSLMSVERRRLEQADEAREQTAREIREASGQLRWLEDNIPGSYVYQYTRGSDGRPVFAHVSAGAEKLHQVTVADVLRDARAIYGQVSPDQGTTLLAAEAESLRGMSDFDQELRILRPDGQSRWLHLRSRPRCRPDGQVVWDGVATDVTGQKQAHEIVRESQEQLRSLVALLPDALFINQDDRVVFANQRALEVWRAGHERQVLGRSPMDFIHPEEHGQVRARIAGMLQSGGNAPIWETRMVALDGTVVPVETTASLLTYGGRPAIQVVVRDITERKRAEAALRASEERLRIVTGSARVGLVMVDPEHRYIFANATYAEILNLLSADIVGLRVGDVLAGVYEEQIRPRLDRAFAGERVSYQLQRPAAGKVRHYAVNYEPTKTGDRVTAVVVVITDITDLKLVEEKLRLHEAVLRETGRIAKVGGWTHDVATGEGYWTEEVARIHDLAPDAPTSKAIGLGYYEGESRRRLEAAMDAAVQTGSAYDLELEMISAKGVRKWVRTIGHPIIDQGKVVSLHGSFQDITERHQQDAERERQQRRLALLADISRRLVLSDSPGAILSGIFNDLSRELQVDIYANYMVSAEGDKLLLESSGGLTEPQRRDFAELPFGVSLCGLVAQRREHLVFADLPTVSVPQAAGIIELGVRAYAGFPLLTGNRLIGTISFGSRRLQRYTADDVSLMRTVVDQVAAAVERSRLLAALRTGEERFRQVVESIQEVFWMTDVEKQRVLYISPGFEAIWGRSCGSVYASMAVWKNSIHAEDRERVIEAARTRQVAGTYHETYRIIRPDGAIRWVRDRAFPVKDHNGLVQRVVGVAEDITERKDLEKQFLHAQRMEAIGTLASGVAHDLNNILAPMLMVAGILKLRENVPAKDLELLAIIENSGQRGAGIIRQLLAFSRGLSGDRVTLQPKHLVHEMTKIMGETFPRNIAIVESTPTDLWMVEADATQLHQVIMNLCVNARDAMPAGGTLTVEGCNLTLPAGAETSLDAAARPGPYVRLQVRDTGTGIAPEIISRIFDPFFTTKGVGKGTGLGLSTVLGIVKSHGGFLKVLSEPGRGSIFQVYLPAVEERAAPVRRDSSSPLPGGKGEEILIVDDEASIREAAGSLLERHGYRVRVAGSGEDAMKVFLEHQATLRLVLTDIMMPGMDGLALIRALRVLDPAIPIVATSGLDQSQNAAEFSALGVGQTLAKPFASAELLKAVGGNLASSARLRS